MIPGEGDQRERGAAQAGGDHRPRRADLCHEQDDDDVEHRDGALQRAQEVEREDGERGHSGRRENEALALAVGRGCLS